MGRFRVIPKLAQFHHGVPVVGANKYVDFGIFITIKKDLALVVLSAAGSVREATEILKTD